MPPLLLLGGISGAGMMSTMERYRPLLMGVTVVFLGAAFFTTYRSANSQSKMIRFNKAMLWAVTVVAVLFLFFPQSIMGFLDSDDEFSEEMERTVMVIEGMT